MESADDEAVIAQAVGVLMVRRDLSAEAAARFLQRIAEEIGADQVEVAASIIRSTDQGRPWFQEER
jgi:AmiR/NasT family two-component response regulator